MTDDLIGPVIDGGMVEAAALSIVAPKHDAYLRALAARNPDLNVDSLEPVHGWRAISAGVQHAPEDAPPTGLLLSRGLADRPRLEGDGTYTARWRLSFAVYLLSTSREATRALAQLYAAAGAQALLQHGGLGGLAAGVDWVDESYDDLGPLDDRTQGLAFAHFEVTVPRARNTFGEAPDADSTAFTPDEAVITPIPTPLEGTP